MCAKPHARSILARRARLALELLEDRRMLEASPIYYDLVADYRDDFRTEAPLVAGWEYLWNAPSGWTKDPGVTGDMATGAITDLSSYRALESPAAITSWTADGNDLGTDHTPDRYVRLTSTGGHTGLHAGGVAGNTIDRYAIAAYTVNQTGFYSIVDSLLKKASTSGDGIEVLVLLGSGGASRQLLQDVVDPGKEIDFDTQPFFAKANDTIYVCIGPDGTDGYDTFSLDFSMVRYRPETLTTIADYRDNFRADAPLVAGWQYLWNAPNGWTTAPGVTGDMATGAIGDPSCYRAMLDAGSYWTSDGNTSGTDHNPDRFVRLSSTGGHPGSEAGYPTGNQHDRYAIAAYTVQQSGRYAITSSFLTNSNASTDGVEVLVHINNRTPILVGGTAAGLGATTNFDADLGYLVKGDTVYVALGTKNSANSDSFSLDFTITQFAPRPQPVRTLGTIDAVYDVTAYGATPNNDTDDDLPRIQAALDAAKTYQLAHPAEKVEVRFAPGTYHLYAKGTTAADFVPNSGTPLRLNNVSNVLINGQGASLLLRNPTRSLFSIDHVTGVIVQDLVIDYTSNNPAAAPNARLPFTQGVITAVNSTQKTVTVTIDSGFAELSAPNFHTQASPAYAPEFNAHVVDPNHPGRFIEGEQNQYHYDTSGTYYQSLGSRQYVVPMSTVSGLAAGQHLVFYMRSSHLVNASYTTDLTFQNLDIYACPHMGVAGGYNDRINILDVHMGIKPDSGRLFAINADALHLPSGRGGVWIENSFFEAMGDDGLNIRPYAFGIQRVVAGSGDRTFEVVRLIYQTGGTTTTAPITAEAFRVGERVTFYDTQTGKVLVRAKVAAVDLTNSRITLDRAVTGVTTIDSLAAGVEEKYCTQVYDTDLAAHFVIRDSVWQNHRARGLLIKTESGQILGNRFEGQSLPAIQMQNEPYWPEGFVPRNITIYGNDFIDVGYTYDYVGASGAHGVVMFQMAKDTPGGASSEVVNGEQAIANITIAGNRFIGWRPDAILGRNARRVEIIDNEFHRPDPPDTASPALRPIELKSVVGATITNNATAVYSDYTTALVTYDSYSSRITESGTLINNPPTAATLSNNHVAENQPSGTVVGNLSSTDPDAGDTLLYRFVTGTGSTDNGSFTIVKESGVWKLKTAAVFDYETKTSYSIRVRTLDRFENAVDAVLTIYVDNVTEGLRLTMSAVDAAIGDLYARDRNLPVCAVQLADWMPTSKPRAKISPLAAAADEQTAQESSLL